MELKLLIFLLAISFSSPAAIPSRFQEINDFQHCLIEYLNSIGIIQFTSPSISDEYFQDCHDFHNKMNKTVRVMYNLIQQNLIESLDDKDEAICMVDVFRHTKFMEYNVIATAAVQLQPDGFRELKNLVQISKNIFTYATMKCLISKEMVSDLFVDLAHKINVDDEELSCILSYVTDNGLFKDDNFVKDQDEFLSEIFEKRNEDVEDEGGLDDVKENEPPNIPENPTNFTTSKNWNLLTTTIFSTNTPSAVTENYLNEFHKEQLTNFIESTSVSSDNNSLKIDDQEILVTASEVEVTTTGSKKEETVKLSMEVEEEGRESGEKFSTKNSKMEKDFFTTLAASTPQSTMELSTPSMSTLPMEAQTFIDSTQSPSTTVNNDVRFIFSIDSSTVPSFDIISTKLRVASDRSEQVNSRKYGRQLGLENEAKDDKTVTENFKIRTLSEEEKHFESTVTYDMLTTTENLTELKPLTDYNPKYTENEEEQSEKSEESYEESSESSTKVSYETQESNVEGKQVNENSIKNAKAKRNSIETEEPVEENEENKGSDGDEEIEEEIQENAKEAADFTTSESSKDFDDEKLQEKSENKDLLLQEEPQLAVFSQNSNFETKTSVPEVEISVLEAENAAPDHKIMNSKTQTTFNEQLEDTSGSISSETEKSFFETSSLISSKMEKKNLEDFNESSQENSIEETSMSQKDSLRTDNYLPLNEFSEEDTKSQELEKITEKSPQKDSEEMESQSQKFVSSKEVWKVTESATESTSNASVDYNLSSDMDVKDSQSNQKDSTESHLENSKDQVYGMSVLDSYSENADLKSSNKINKYSSLELDSEYSSPPSESQTSLFETTKASIKNPWNSSETKAESSKSKDSFTQNQHDSFDSLMNVSENETFPADTKMSSSEASTASLESPSYSSETTTSLNYSTNAFNKSTSSNSPSIAESSTINPSHTTTKSKKFRRISFKISNSSQNFTNLAEKFAVQTKKLLNDHTGSADESIEASSENSFRKLADALKTIPKSRQELDIPDARIKRDLSTYKSRECTERIDNLKVKFTRYNFESLDSELNMCMGSLVTQQDIDDFFVFVVLRRFGSKDYEKNKKLMNLIVSFIGKFIECTDLYGFIQMAGLPNGD